MVDVPLFVHFPNELADVGDCEEVRQVYGVLERFVTYRRPGSFLVDTFPSLASIPSLQHLLQLATNRCRNP